MHVAVGPVLRAHVVEVVAGGELPPVGAGAASSPFSFSGAFELVSSCSALDCIALPSQADRSRSVSAQEIMCGTSISPTGS